ncbi:hypothetical protein SAMN05216558_3720 [Pseudomonas vancouverensis]|nr:hypothetical protein SAMN05216558_3720 [Pseudomonas vancouverensis]
MLARDCEAVPIATTLVYQTHRRRLFCDDLVIEREQAPSPHKPHSPPATSQKPSIYFTKASPTAIHLWRASLLALGCEAAPIAATLIYQTHHRRSFCDDFVIERERAPSPHKPHSPPATSQKPSIYFTKASPTASHLWRASLLALGCEAVPIATTLVYQTHHRRSVCDNFVIEREQAPSPHKPHSPPATSQKPSIYFTKASPTASHLWRASLLALGCEAAPIAATLIYQTHHRRSFCDDFVIEREQAPSPHKPHSPPATSQKPSIYFTKASPTAIHLWRASLLALDCEAVPIATTLVYQTHRRRLFCDDLVIEREQAPSPQKLGKKNRSLRQLLR